MDNCIICGSKTSIINDPQLKVEYDVCDYCGFVHKKKSFHLEFELENEQYDRHENTIENEGYVNIFKELIENFIKDLNITGKILEFGSGPNPVFKVLLEEAGYQVKDFDPFYNQNEDYKNHKYQMITSNEVPEHFANPIKEFDLLVSLLEPRGYLLLSSHFRNMDMDKFLHWWYRRDVTHVSFYNLKTYEYLCKKYDLEIIKHDNKKVILLQKK